MALMTKARVNYGIDAPPVVRNLFLAGAAGFLLWALTVLKVWSGTLVIPLFGNKVNLAIAPSALATGAACAFMGFWMVWDSRVGKVRRREWLLNRIPWKGDEQVLDLGCGRGLMLIGAAKRLKTGMATGVDIWQAVDLSGNRPEAVLENAKLEGVAERVAVKTADMRALPFPNDSFDVVLSRAAIHNLYKIPERASAVTEVARVLKPGGYVLIDDVRHGNEYVAVLTSHGCADVQRFEFRPVSWLVGFLSRGAIEPVVLLARKKRSPASAGGSGFG